MRINAEKVEILLAEQGKTKQALSRKCGISPQSISTIIRRGSCEPRNAGKLAAALGVHVMEIAAPKSS